MDPYDWIDLSCITPATDFTSLLYIHSTLQYQEGGGNEITTQHLSYTGEVQTRGFT